MLRGFETRSIDLRGKTYTKYGVWQFDLRNALFVVEAAQLIDKPNGQRIKTSLVGSACQTSGTTCDPLSDKKREDRKQCSMQNHVSYMMLKSHSPHDSEDTNDSEVTRFIPGVSLPPSPNTLPLPSHYRSPPTTADQYSSEPSETLASVSTTIPTNVST
jgi:hypothetical protein